MMKDRTTSDNLHSDRKIQNYFTAYLTKALKNNRLHYIAKQSKLSMIDFIDDISDDMCYELGIDHTFESFEQRYTTEMDSIDNLLLLAALRQLNEKDRTIIRLHVIYGYSYREVANMLGMTPTSVSTRYSRAIAQIRQRMEASK